MTMNRILSILVAILVAATVTAQTTRRTTSKASGNPNAAAVVATVDGVGPLKLCLPMKKIPAKYAGLYDNFKKAPVEADKESLQGNPQGQHKLTFYKDGKVVMTTIVAEWDDAPYGGIREITLPAGSPIKFRIAPNKYILPNCPLSEVFSKATLTAGGLVQSEAYYTDKTIFDVINKPADYDWKTAGVIIQNANVIKDDRYITTQSKTLDMFKPDTKINGIDIRYWVNEF